MLNAITQSLWSDEFKTFKEARRFELEKSEKVLEEIYNEVAMLTLTKQQNTMGKVLEQAMDTVKILKQPVKPLIILTSTGFGVLELKFLERLRDTFLAPVQEWTYVLIDTHMDRLEMKQVEDAWKKDMASALGIDEKDIALKYFKGYEAAQYFIDNRPFLFPLAAGAINMGRRGYQPEAQSVSILEEERQEASFWNALKERRASTPWIYAYYNDMEGHVQGVETAARQYNKQAGKVEILERMAVMYGVVP
tara:strand:- start:51 stop:800 length:750 start_codon:yes stop_codon:yes gene_type:complete